MKRIIPILGFIALGLHASAQCSPNQAYADSAFGAWPDTTTNFSNGIVGVFYSDTLNLLVPSDAGDVNPQYTGLVIDSVALVQVNGLPPGITVTCNSHTSAPCTFLSAQVGCGLIEGTPTQVGTFPMTISVNAYITLPIVGPQAVPYSFPGYSITIEDSDTGLEELEPARISGVKNVPNPYSERTRIEFGLTKAAPVQVKVYNLVGEELWNRTVQGKPGLNKVSFDGTRLESGIYFYQVEAEGSKYTGRMMINR